MSDKAKEGPDHGKLLRQFEEAFDGSQEERRLSERDRDYYDGKQLTEEEMNALRQRKQPIVISNRIKPKIDSLLGFERKQRTDPRAYPRTPKHDQDAQGVTDAIRFVCDQSRFQSIRSSVAESMFVEGVGAATVTMTKRPDGEMDVQITDVPWDRFYRDPHSRRRDFSDASYMGVVLWMDEADVLADFSDKAEVVMSCYADDSSAEGETYDDRPKMAWADKKRARVRVLQHRWREKGVWMTAIVCKGGFLRDPQKSPYLDEYGRPECDLIPVSCYVTRENERYGAARMMISAQDEINKRRSKALHRLSVRQVVAEHGAVEDVAHAKAELAKPDGFIEVRPDARFEIQQTDQFAAGEMELLREAKAEIDASGVNPALEGDVQAPSGRAVEALTAAGLAETAVAFDALRDWSWRVYRQVWNRVRQYWTEERWVRVTDDERNLKWVGINKPVTAGEEFERLKAEAQEMMAQGQQPPPPPPELIQALQIDPNTVIRTDNKVAELDVDIVLEEGPDSVTIQSEQFEQLVELKKADPASIPTQMVIEASSLRNKDKILEHMEKGGVPPELQQKMQEMEQALQECQQQLQAAEQAKGVEKQEAQALVAKTQADIKVANAELAAREAEMEAKQAQFELQMTKQAMAQMQAQTAERDAMPKSEPAPQQDNATPAALVAGFTALIQATNAPKQKTGRMARMPDGSYEVTTEESAAE